MHLLSIYGALKIRNFYLYAMSQQSFGRRPDSGWDTFLVRYVQP